MTLANNLHVSPYDEHDNVQLESCPKIATNNDEYQKAITPRSIRYFILISTIIESIIFSGLIFGWPALFYMLKNEQIYSYLCSNNNYNNDDDDIDDFDINQTTINPNVFVDKQLQHYGRDNCIPQENILNMAFTIGIFSMGFTSFAWGFLLESKGLRFVRIALNLLISVGCFLLSITDSDTSIRIIPAIIILGLVGVPLRIANMQIADFFPLKRSTIITLFSGAFSASPVIFVLIKYGYDNWSLSYFWATFTLFLTSITLLPLNTFCLPRLSVRTREKTLLKRYDEYCAKIEALDMEMNKGKPHFINNKMLKTITDQMNEQESNKLLLQQPDNNANSTTKTPIIVNFSQFQREKEAIRKPNLLKRIFKPVKTADTENELPLRVSLVSISFLMHQLWFSWINTYMVLYSGSMALWLDRVTDDNREKSQFTQTFGLVQVSALIIAPIAGDVIDRIVRRAQHIQDANGRRLMQAQSGFGPVLFTTLTLLGAVICRFFDTSIAVYLSIAFITILRALFIAVASAYLRVRYPANHFNRLNGIMCTIGAFFSLLQFPLFYFESKSHLGAFQVNSVCAILTVLCLLNPLSLRIGSIQKRLIDREQCYGKYLMESKSNTINNNNNNNNHNNNVIN
ncbi:equilibrative nucleobase transporter 1-like isoform X2 [Dermatophagoides pteronyssinus]|uniref:equilibrative nucleobase transporter 1-like isoform X2 n=1 Tax=Dermatophagoides pteronyssinus TaxID=6956 RepID=UPI003F6709B2